MTLLRKLFTHLARSSQQVDEPLPHEKLCSCQIHTEALVHIRYHCRSLRLQPYKVYLLYSGPSLLVFLFQFLLPLERFFTYGLNINRKNHLLLGFLGSFPSPGRLCILTKPIIEKILLY